MTELVIDIDKAAKLWADGIPASEIADQLGCTRRYLYNVAEHHRDHFPVRYVNTRAVSEAKAQQPTPPDRVRRITLSGAVVTLPRIPTIDGY